MRRRFLGTGRTVLVLFAAAALSQAALPLLHLRDVDAQESNDCCKGHPTSHVESDPGPSHHDSGACPVCRIIQSSQPADVLTLGTIALSIPPVTSVAILSQTTVLGEPLPTHVSPRGPPASL